MTFLYRISKNGAAAEGCISAGSEQEAGAKLEAKFPQGSKVKVLGLEQAYVATRGCRRSRAARWRRRARG